MLQIHYHLSWKKGFPFPDSTVPRTWVLLQLFIGLFANIIAMNVSPTVTYVTTNRIVICGNKLLTYFARKLNHLVETVFPYFLCQQMFCVLF